MNAGFFVRTLVRESRGSKARLVIITLCLAIGVAAVTAVSGLVSGFREGLRGQSRELIAADFMVHARRALPDELDPIFASIPGAERTDVRLLPTMVAAETGGPSRLATLKVLDGRYPFYGDLGLDPAGKTLAELLDGDHCVVGPGMLDSLEVAVGDRIVVGGAPFTIAAIARTEPDRMDFSTVIGPRVFLDDAGFSRTAVFGFTAHIDHRALYRLPTLRTPAELKALEKRIRAELPDATYLRMSSHYDAQPGVQRALERIESYFGLVALLSLLLGGVGVAHIVGAWVAGRTRHIAVLKSIGFRPREILALHLGHVGLLALAGSVVGGALGLLLIAAAPRVLPDLLPMDRFALWQPLALLRGIALGLSSAILFALPPLTAVWRVPAARVLRAEAVPLPAPWQVRVSTGLALIAGVLGIAWTQADRIDWALAFTAGLLVLVGLLTLGARFAMRLGGWLPRRRLHPYLMQGLAALGRPGAGTTGAVMALGLGMLLVTTMVLGWKKTEEGLTSALPGDAPTLAMLNIRPDAWSGVRALLEEEGATSIRSAPIVFGRIREVDGRPVEEMAKARKKKGRSRWALTREQWLTSAEELPASNTILEGELWCEPGQAEVSVEKRFARQLEVELGSTILLEAGGKRYPLKVTSIREIDWMTLELNFYVVVEPGVLDHAVAFRVAGACLPPEREQLVQDRINREHAGVTVFRIRPILGRVVEMMAGFALAERVLGAFTVLVGLAILAGAVSAAGMRRAREVALLKTLGATRRGVVVLLATEYGLAGLVAGLIGGFGAVVLAWVYADHVFGMGGGPDWIALPLSGLVAAVLAAVCGVAASGRALTARPVESLRAG